MLELNDSTKVGNGMLDIYQADQYFISFRVEQDGKVIAPEDVDGVRIALGGIIQSYPDGELTYDKSENWLFWLNADDTKDMVENVPCQVELKKGQNRQHSPVFYVEVQKSVLKGIW